MLEFSNSFLNNINWPSFLLASVLMASTPGANQILCLRNGLQSGAKKAIQGMLGRFLAFTIMILAVSIGIGAFISTSPYVLTFIKWTGVFYLLWIGIRTLFYKKKEGPEEYKTQEDSSTTSIRLIKEEFIVAFLNPKAYILFAIFLPQFIQRHSEGVGAKIILIGCMYIGIEFICACAYAFTGHTLKKSSITSKVKNNLDRVTGFVMIIIAVLLGTQNFM